MLILLLFHFLTTFLKSFDFVRIIFHDFTD